MKIINAVMQGRSIVSFRGLILIFTPESPSLSKESSPWEVPKIICSFIIMNSNELSRSRLLATGPLQPD